MIKRCIFFFYFWFYLLITWCWINTFKRCYHCALHSPLLAFWEHSLPVDWKGLRPTNLQSQNAPELAPQIHTVYSRTQLSMVPFWFSKLHKKPTVTLLFIWCLLYWFQHTVCFCFTMIQSALGFFFFLSFLRENETGRWQNASFGKRTGAQMYFCCWNLG